MPEDEVRTAVVVRDDGAILLARRPETGLLGGLWELPGDDGGWHPSVAALLEAGEAAGTLDTVAHTFSHKRVRYRPEVVQVDGAVAERLVPGSAAGLAWAAPDQLDAFALPVAQQKIMAAIADATAV